MTAIATSLKVNAMVLSSTNDANLFVTKVSLSYEANRVSRWYIKPRRYLNRRSARPPDTDVRFCRRECGIGVAVAVEGVHRVAMAGDAAGVSAVADAGSTVSGVRCAGANLDVLDSIGHDLNAAT